MNLTLKQRWKKLREDLKPMSFREKVDHLWTYYYWVLIVVAILVTLCLIVHSSVTNLRKEVLVAGVLVNADVSVEGHDFLEEDYFKKLNGKEGDQEIQITDVTFEDPNTTLNIEQTYTASVRLIAMVAAKEVDYVIMDKIGLEFYLGQDIFMDLTELLSQEELEKWKDDFIYLTYDDTGETVPVAINLKNTEFAEKYCKTDKQRYIAFAGNTQRPDACKILWEYLKEGQ